MANWIKIIANKWWFKDSEQEVDLDSLVKGEGITGFATEAYVDAEIDKEGLYLTTIASSATPTPARASKRNMFTVTALSDATATFAVPSGTPLEGDILFIRIKDNGAARALAWNAIYRVGTDIALSLTTVAGKTMYLGFIYNFTDTKWDLVALCDGF